jgi:AcrR family transcriptional regulator
MLDHAAEDSMGRKSGVSAAETNSRLLRSAALVFARRGFSGATIAEIASEADLSSGSIYAHYAGKSDLFLAVLEAHGRAEISRNHGDVTENDIIAYLIRAGSDLDERPVAERTLVIEAIMAAKHDPAVRSALSAWFTEQHDFFATSLGEAQDSGGLRTSFSSAAAARFALAVALGTLVLNVLDVPHPGKDEWSAMIRDVVASLRQPQPTERLGDRSARV